MSRRGLHVPISGVALSQMERLRTFVHMAKVRKIKGRPGYYMDFKDAGNKRRLRKGGDTEGEAQFNLTLETDKRLAAKIVGTRTARIREYETAPIAGHIEDYRAMLEATQCTPRHVAWTIDKLIQWVNACEVETIQDADPVRTQTWLGQKLKSGLSARTCNAYLVAAKSFLNWCEKNGRSSIRPLRGLELFRAKPVMASRSLTVAGYAALIGSVTGRRKLWYLLAGRMGLRWGEIGRLMWHQFDLEGGWLVLSAEDTKARRGDELPIPSDVAEVAAMLKSEGRVFSGSIDNRTWRKDLVRAGVVRLVNKDLPIDKRYAVDNLDGYATTAGQLDRKCLRKTYGTHLALAGVDLRIAQRLMRHSDPKLTANVYTDPMLLDMRGAANRLSATLAQHETIAMVGGAA